MRIRFEFGDLQKYRKLQTEKTSDSETFYAVHVLKTKYAWSRKSAFLDPIL